MVANEPTRYTISMRHDEEPPIELDLMRTGLCVELHVKEPVVVRVPGPDDIHVGDALSVGIEGRIGDEEDDDVEFAAFALIFTLGALSFAEAKPRGASVVDHRENDDWTASDMLRGLTFTRGELHFHADYVRGRMMKTTVVVRRDGTFRLETVNRGHVARAWLAQIMDIDRPAPADKGPVN